MPYCSHVRDALCDAGLRLPARSGFAADWTSGRSLGSKPYELAIVPLGQKAYTFERVWNSRDRRGSCAPGFVGRSAPTLGNWLLGKSLATGVLRRPCRHTVRDTVSLTLRQTAADFLWAITLSSAVLDMYAQV